MSTGFDPAPEFHFYFPVYALWDESSNEPIAVKNPQGTMMMLFTDRNLADEFLSVRPRARTLPVELHHPKSLIDLVELVKAKNGATHVAIDVSFIQTQAGLKSNRHAVAEIDFFVESVRRDWLATPNNGDGAG